MGGHNFGRNYGMGGHNLGRNNGVGRHNSCRNNSMGGNISGWNLTFLLFSLLQDTIQLQLQAGLTNLGNSCYQNAIFQVSLFGAVGPAVPHPVLGPDVRGPS